MEDLGSGTSFLMSPSLTVLPAIVKARIFFKKMESFHAVILDLGYTSEPLSMFFPVLLLTVNCHL